MKWDTTRWGRTDAPCSLDCCWFGVGKVVRKKYGKKNFTRFSYIYTSPLPISLFGSFLLQITITQKKKRKKPHQCWPEKHSTPILGHNAELDFYKDRQVAVSSGVTPAGCRHFWCSKPEGQRFHSDAKVTRCQSEDGPQSHRVEVGLPSLKLT